MRLIAAATLLLGMASAAAQNTKWTEKSLPDPILPGAKCEVATPGSFGSAIYEAPSKFDQVFWPITSPDGIWFCRQSGFAAFVGDFVGIDAEQRSAIAGFLAATYKTQRRRPELPELLALLEGCYVQRRLAPRQQITVLRALAYQHEQMGNLPAAESRRSEALDLILAQLESDTLEPPQRLEYLFVASVYSRWFRENSESGKFLKTLREALKHPDAAVPESYAKYLRELVKDVPRVRSGGRLAPGSD